MRTTFNPSRSRSTTAWGIFLSVVVTAPLVVLLFLLDGRNPNGFSDIFVALAVLIGGFMLYFTLMARRMSYELQDDGLRVNLGLSGARIPYGAIKNVSLSRVMLVLRLFGGSWPGFHWGLFEAKGLGRVSVYATSAMGEFILIRLVNGDKVVLSPDKPEGFLEAISVKSGSFGSMKPEDLATEVPRMAVYAQVLALIIAYAAFLGYILWVYPSLPEVLPVHFSLNGSPDRWGDKSELFLLAGVGAIFPIINTILVLKFGKYDKGLTIFLGVIFTLIMALFIYITNVMLSYT